MQALHANALEASTIGDTRKCSKCGFLLPERIDAISHAEWIAWTEEIVANGIKGSQANGVFDTEMSIDAALDPSGKKQECTIQAQE